MTCFLLAACAGAPPAEPSGPSAFFGVWEMESDLGGRVIPASLILEPSEDGGLRGTWESQGMEMELEEVEAREGRLSFFRQMGQEGPRLHFVGRLDGDALRGEQLLGDRTIPCTGRRFKLSDLDAGTIPTREESGDQEAYLDALEADFDAHAHRAVPRDGFDVLDEPELVPAAEATTLEPDEEVLGITLGGESRAYPIGALGNSELLNDVCGGVAIAAGW